MRTLGQDVTFALRTLRRRPAFATVAIATLALGVGAATAIFTIIDGVLLRPLPFRNAGELVTVWQTDTRFRDQTTLRRRWDRLWFTFPEYQQWRDGQRSFSDVAIHGDQEMALTGVGAPTQVAVSTATPSLLPLLGTRVSLGRWFLPGEEGPGTERLAVISHEMWVSRFGSDPTVVGRFITLDDARYRIVGVMPAGFRLRRLTSSIVEAAAVWIPLGSDGGGQQFDSSYEGIARLRPGVSLDAAMLETDRIVRAAAGRTERGARIVPRLEAETAAARAPLVLLGAGVVLLLLIACANITMLLLGEASAREHEIATRKALGASVTRIVRQLFTESAVIATAGGLLGATLAWVGTRLLVAVAPASMPRLDEVVMDGRVLAVALGVTVGAAVSFGLAPAVSTSRRAVADTLRGSTRQAGRRRSSLLDAVIVVQVAMSLVLLAGAGVLGRSLRALWTVDPGFTTDAILTMSVTVPESRYAEREAVGAYYARLAQRLESLPGVGRVAATSNLPLSGRNSTTAIDLEGVPTANPSERPNVQRRVVTPEYFTALGIPLRAGRGLGGEPAGEFNELIIDEAMARRSWPNEPALGKRVRVFGAWFTVVGVVGNVRHTRLDEDEQPTIYLPHSRVATREMTMVLATSGDPAALASVVRSATWSVDPAIPIAELEPLASRVARSISPERYRTTLLGAFGLAAAVLTAVGVFGVVARTVSQRRREIAIRLALGAARSSIARAVTRDLGRSVGLGLALGLVGAWLLSPLLGRFVFGVGPSDPMALSGAIALMVLMAGLAALPAVRRALRTDPGLALRQEQ
ncbi:MAG: permease [Geminicoccaceae bacterium]|nr:permease [Geminicoccaceae bacterium]